MEHPFWTLAFWKYLGKCGYCHHNLYKPRQPKWISGSGLSRLLDSRDGCLLICFCWNLFPLKLGLLSQGLRNRSRLCSPPCSVLVVLVAAGSAFSAKLTFVVNLFDLVKDVFAVSWLVKCLQWPGYLRFEVNHYFHSFRYPLINCLISFDLASLSLVRF